MDMPMPIDPTPICSCPPCPCAVRQLHWGKMMDSKVKGTLWEKTLTDEKVCRIWHAMPNKAHHAQYCTPCRIWHVMRSPMPPKKGMDSIRDATEYGMLCARRCPKKGMHPPHGPLRP
eukprot:4160399-Prymnesium_polylepis.2